MNRSRCILLLAVVAAVILTSLSFKAPTAVASTEHARSSAAGTFNPLAASSSKYPCQAPFGSVQISTSAWAGSLVNTGHDGATFDVYSNYRSGRIPASCAGDWVSADGTDQWGLKYQCTELAVRVADGEWGIGNNTAWKNAGWNGAADAMRAPGQRLGLTWTGNGSGSLPAPGDLMIWKSSGGTDPGHVAVVSAVGGGTVTFVGENQGYGMVSLPVSGTTVENNGWKPGSSILGWLSKGNASPSWTIQPTPNPSGGVNSSFNGVSCVSATSCTAVGTYTNSANTWVTLAEFWNGSTWAIQPTPNPSGGDYNRLYGVSCVSAASCTAVGTYTNKSGVEVTLAEHWNGSTWAIQSTPNRPRAAETGLEAVSCASATSCTAVGWYATNTVDAPFAEHWNGSTWAIQPTPDPTTTYSGGLAGVSCVSATNCTAVGSSDLVPLAEWWNGSTWAIQPAPNPSSSYSSFEAVSCVSATSCTAVGYTQVGTMAEHWNGTTWAIQSTPNPSSSYGSELVGVSCVSASSCTAVAGGFAEYWNGSTWVIQPLLHPNGAGVIAISCISAATCTAVGAYAGRTTTTLAEHE